MDFFGFEVSLQGVLSVTMILFAVIDIIGAVPIIVDLRNKTGHIHAEQASLVSLAIMIFFLLTGEFILKLIGVDVPSFAIAGSFVIFFIALEMLLGIRIYRDEEHNTSSIVPLAFPLIAGTGTMTTLLSLRAEYNVPTIIIGIVLNIGFVYLTLRSLGFFERVLGKAGMSIMRKVFGVVLLAIAIKLFRTNAGI